MRPGNSCCCWRSAWWREPGPVPVRSEIGPRGAPSVRERLLDPRSRPSFHSHAPAERRTILMTPRPWTLSPNRRLATVSADSSAGGAGVDRCVEVARWGSAYPSPGPCGVLQQGFGDCLVVEGQQARPHAPDPDRRRPRRYIPGGVASVPHRHRRGRWSRIDVAVLSHIDNDHVLGLLRPVRGAARPRGRWPPPARCHRSDGLWHNAFARAVGGADIEPRVRAPSCVVAAVLAAMPGVARAARRRRG